MRGTKAAGELEAALANLDFDCKNKDAGVEEYLNIL
jgi:hypothetical protein